MTNGEFHVWHGNVKVIPVSQEVLGDIGQTRFDSCQHRSPEQETKIRPTCCGSTKQTGYKCQALGIFGVKPQNCATCDKYLKKDT